MLVPGNISYLLALNVIRCGQLVVTFISSLLSVLAGFQVGFLYQYKNSCAVLSYFLSVIVISLIYGNGVKTLQPQNIAAEVK